MKNKIHDSILQYGKELEKYSHKVSPHFHEPTIHHFRTATKKLRALLRWQNIPKDFLPAPFVKIYHASGNLRNAQVLIIGLTEDKIKLPGFMLWLATFIGKQELDWNEMYHKKTLRKLQQKLLSVELQKPGTKPLQLFFTKQVHKMQRVVELPAPADDTLHEVRKMVKDMLYIRQWCKKNWAEGNNATKNFSFLQLKKLGEQAGHYNDKRTELLLIATYLNEEKNDKAIKAARAIQKEQEQQKATLKKELLASLLQFCERVQHC